MTWKEFFIQILGLASIDITIGCLLYLFWKYLDLKYFSTFDIETLRRENEYLKFQNQNLNGESSDFWNGGDI